MIDAPAFFVPSPVATPLSQEDVYAELAKWCQSAVPQPEKRIYSITFIHDCEEWTATVGKTLSGIKRTLSGPKHKKIEQTVHLADRATVLAIFPGSPCMVVTDHGTAGGVGSAWVNPFMAGQPQTITYFSKP